MKNKSKKADPAEMLARFRRRFWQPPRRHGEVIEDRSVGFIELFYDLVYVVLIARAAHTLAHHLSWQGVGEFATIFGLIWIAWVNGTLYQDLHGREDARSRTFIFIQMLLLALLGVFTEDAAGEGGQGFATTYVALLLVFTWLWYAVRKQDTPEYEATTRRYLTGMVVSIAMMGASIWLPDDPRLVVWAVLVLGWVATSATLDRAASRGSSPPLTTTDSMVERLGLFTIIVLGEVVVGVVNGLSDADRTLTTVATGLLGLTIGFGFWWTYFDFVSNRLPRQKRMGTTQWLLSHLPVTMAIAGAGAAMVNLVEHAGDSRAPAAAAWLLAGSVALMLVSLIVTMSALADFDRLPRVYRPTAVAMVVGATLSLLVGWWRPAPWVLALVVSAILGAIWWFGVDRWLRHGRANAAAAQTGSSL